MTPRETLTAFDRYLADRGLRFEAVVVGATALNLLGVVVRTTKDCDVLAPPVPAAIAAAARAFAAALRARGEILDDEWLNDGPGSLAAQLLPAWQARTRPVFTGSALRLSTLGREDLLGSKLFALCDRGIDLGDCLALAPTAEELRALLPWVEQQDANADWPAHVRATLTDLARRLGHAL